MRERAPSLASPARRPHAPCLNVVCVSVQINFASSIYVLYMAFLVIVTPPFIVYG